MFGWWMDWIWCCWWCWEGLCRGRPTWCATPGPMSTALKQIQAEPQRDREVARKLRARRSGLGLLNVRSEQSGKISAKHSKLLVIRCHLIQMVSPGNKPECGEWIDHLVQLLYHHFVIQGPFIRAPSLSQQMILHCVFNPDPNLAELPFWARWDSIQGCLGSGLLPGWREERGRVGQKIMSTRPDSNTEKTSTWWWFFDRAFCLIWGEESTRGKSGISSARGSHAPPLLWPPHSSPLSPHSSPALLLSCRDNSRKKQFRTIEFKIQEKQKHAPLLQMLLPSRKVGEKKLLHLIFLQSITFESGLAWGRWHNLCLLRDF